MEAADSEGENNQNNSDSPIEEPKRPKRQMKTPYQLEVLETTYASEMYPSEERRAELSEKLGLSDRQLQMWFCHRRLKDKKDGAVKKPVSTKVVGKKELIDSGPPNDLLAAEGGSGHGSRSGSGSGSGSSQFDYGDDVPIRRYFEPPLLQIEREVIACVEAQLGEPLRDDGPILGMEFDEPPPGAFGEPIVMAEQQGRSWHSYEGESYDQYNFRPTKAAMMDSRNYLLDDARIRSDVHGQHEPSKFYDFAVESPSTSASMLPNGNGKMSRGFGVVGPVSCPTSLSQQGTQGNLSPLTRDNNGTVQSKALINMQMDAPNIVRPVVDPDAPGKHIPISEKDLRVERKRKCDEPTNGRLVETQEKRIRKELEKQDILRHKREEQMRREMEKQDRERRRDEERLMREKQRQQERLEREERREIERREKFLQKESVKAERRRQKEELRREKDEARFKAALERATARRLAKESMELIEDERLELMELAALSKGLPSIVSLDHDSLQNLESFRALLRPFPPKSVQLKRPFAIQPWADSEENIGNLLMVWRFCITFADVLGLWPFTLDEFVQAFHEYDSRLLGEMHIALLKLIIKDIEDVARTPSPAAGTNQCSSAIPEGGHPRIVEGAYIWGFDILNWKFHLNPLTWPEVLRQFALSAGFGPQLKEKSIQLPCVPENDEAKGCEDIVSILRDGSAAQNAIAVMQEKGFPLQRRSRHRLTPGTVKFAAYHVLCLEGSKGLTVIELAHKIQKSGLRDLTTSKTPEASISVALSRDTVLFERTAPSTYRVRTPFRKDAADAEAILSAAREKMKRYENGFIAGENTDDVEREEETDGEVSDSPEIDEFGTPDADKSISNYDEVSNFSKKEENLTDDVRLIKQHEPKGTPINNSTADHANVGNNIDQGDTEIDESNSGELWVQGLAEGEYSELSVEERLNALVALVGISNEGNCIRSILEDRLDAANALKKQMWTEAQLDKKRVKEEIMTKFHYSSLLGNEADIEQTCAAEESPLATVDNKQVSPLNNSVMEPSLGAENMQDHLNGLPPQRNIIDPDASTGQISSSCQQHGFAAEKSRLKMKSYIGQRAEETYVYRSLPLGQDRRHNRYWQFVACASRHDPGSGRIFVETPDGYWRLIDCAEALDALLESLDTRGIRESHLHMMLQKIEKSFKENARSNSHCGSIQHIDGNVGNEASVMAPSPVQSGDDSPSSTLSGLSSSTMEPSSSFRIELGKSEIEKKAALDRYQEFQLWMWDECFNSSSLCAMRYEQKRCARLLGICEFCLDLYIVENNFCPSCQRYFGTFGHKSSNSQNETHFEEKGKLSPKNVSDFSHPLRIRLLKALLTNIEVTVPSMALQSSWTENSRKKWGIKLLASLSAENLLQILTEFEGVIKRDCLLTNFETTEELLASAALSGKGGAWGSVDAGSVPELPWIPQTSSAVALRLFELDGSVSYLPHQKAELDYREAEDITKHPLRFAFLKTAERVEQLGVDKSKHMKVKKRKNLATLHGGSKYRRGVKGRARGRSQKRVLNSITQDVKDDELTLAQVLWQQGQRTHGQKLGRGRRTVRRRRLEKIEAEDTLWSQLRNVDRFSNSPRNLGEAELVDEEIRNMQTDGADNSSSDSLEAVESEDDDACAVEYNQLGNWPTGNSRVTSDDDNDDDDDSEDCNALGEMGEENFQANIDGNNNDDNCLGVTGEDNFDANIDRNEDSDGAEDEGNDSGDSEDYSD